MRSSKPRTPPIVHDRGWNGSRAWDTRPKVQCTRSSACWQRAWRSVSAAAATSTNQAPPGGDGGVLVGLIALGFLGYALWRGVQAIADPDGEGTDLKALGKRIGYGVSALVYAALAFSAVGLILGSASEGGGTPDDWTALLLSWPLGQVLVASVGTAVVGLGLRELYQAYKARFLEYLKIEEMGEKVRKWSKRWGRLGITARGIVFGVVGTFLIRAALEYDPQEARGLGGALQTLAQQPLGQWLLGAVALGLIAYGLFMLSVARYRHIDTGRIQ